jgi:hypothetical protein
VHTGIGIANGFIIHMCTITKDIVKATNDIQNHVIDMLAAKDKAELDTHKYNRLNLGGSQT